MGMPVLGCGFVSFVARRAAGQQGAGRAASRFDRFREKPGGCLGAVRSNGLRSFCGLESGVQPLAL
jgi:hypothetical protein